MKNPLFVIKKVSALLKKILILAKALGYALDRTFLKNIMIDYKGYISLHRKIEDNWLWFADPFSRGQAWIDLLLLANHKPSTVFVRGNRVDVKRGQIVWSKEALGTRWKWSEKKVRTFLKMLEMDGQILKIKTASIVVVEVVNYNFYQQKDGQKTDRRRTEDGQKTADNNVNNENNENKTRDENFEIFWKNYKPNQTSDGKIVNKGDKEVARRSFMKIIGEYTLEEIQSGLQRYLEDCKKNNILSCNAKTFLNEKRFLREEEKIEKKIVVPKTFSMQTNETPKILSDIKFYLDNNFRDKRDMTTKFIAKLQIVNENEKEIKCEQGVFADFLARKGFKIIN